jgi:hypothetical protein
MKYVITTFVMLILLLVTYIGLGAIVPRAEFGYGWGVLYALGESTYVTPGGWEVTRGWRLWLEPFPCARRAHWQDGQINGMNTVRYLRGRKHSTGLNGVPDRIYSPWHPLEDE